MLGQEHRVQAATRDGTIVFVPMARRGARAALLCIALALLVACGLRPDDRRRAPLDHREGSDPGPVREVLDVLQLPELGESEAVIPVDCAVDGRIDMRIFAIGDFDEALEVTKIRRAWRANLEQGKFEEIPTRGVTCVNPGDPD